MSRTVHYFRDWCVLFVHCCCSICPKLLYFHSFWFAEYFFWRNNPVTLTFVWPWSWSYHLWSEKNGSYSFISLKFWDNLKCSSSFRRFFYVRLLFIAFCCIYKRKPCVYVVQSDVSVTVGDGRVKFKLCVSLPPFSAILKNKKLWLKVASLVCWFSPLPWLCICWVDHIACGEACYSLFLLHVCR